jgi:myxalamid-type polyketide synthase MxaE and MxaD
MGFFQMGMDSMLAARVRARIEAAIDRKLPARVMFEHPTIEELSRHIADDVVPPAHVQAAPAAPASASPVAALAELSEDALLAAMAAELSSPNRTNGSSS